MKKYISLILVLLTFASLCACTPLEAHDSFEAMDTFMEVSIYGGRPDWALSSVIDEAKTLDKALSTTDTGDIGLLNKNSENSVSGETLELLNRSVELCSELDGALDITVYPLVEEWGFISRDYKIPSKSRINELVKNVDYTKVEIVGDNAKLPENVKVDLGALAKGFLADKCMDIARSESCDRAIFKLGGTIAVLGTKEDGADWKVGIADPDEKYDYFGVLSCHDTVVATSGGYERSFKGEDGKTYIHIIDPKTGCPVQNDIKSVTIISSDGTRADALSTALYVMGKDKAVEYYKDHRDFDLIVLTNDNKMYISNGISDSFTLSDGYETEIVTVD